MEQKTRLPELTPPHLRLAGIVMIVASAAVPWLAWSFASSVLSLGGLSLAAVGWAIIALAGYLGMRRSTEARDFAVLVCGCAALWAVVLSVGFWFLVRGQIGTASPVSLEGGKVSSNDVMALVGVVAAATGAIYGFFSGIRYRELPRGFGRALRAAAWASLPSVALSLAVFETEILNRYAAFAILAPIVLALALTAIVRAVRGPATTPSGRS